METLDTELTQEKFAACIGLDWGDKGHVYRILDTNSGEIREHKLSQRPDILQKWVTELQMKYPGEKIAIAIEQSKGAVINFLMQYDFFVIYVINPKLAAKYREAFKSSGAKDDGNDSGFILDILTRHRDKLTPWKIEDDTTRMLQILTEKRRNAINERTRLSNRLKAVLKQYYPLALEVAGDSLATVIACSFLQRWTTLESLKRARTATIRDFFTKHGCRQMRVIDNRLKAIEQAKPLTEDPVIVETSSMEVGMLTDQMLIVIRHIEKYDNAINEVFPSHPDAEIFSSLPGAGAVLAPRLLVAFGSDRGRFSSSVEVNNYSGIAPVTVQSGKRRMVRWRWACPKFIRQSFHEFAGESRKHSIWAQAFYDKQRDEGKTHNAAVRALAYKWIRILFRCWQNHETYDELFYINALKKHGSGLFCHIAQA
jgi:transposase